LVLDVRGPTVEQLDLEAGFTQALDPAGRLRIWIACTNDDTRHAGGDHGLRTGRRATGVVAGLERDVQGRTARPLARLRECNRLCMVDVRVLVPALAHDLVAMNEHRAHQRVILDL